MYEIYTKIEYQMSKRNRFLGNLHANITTRNHFFFRSPYNIQLLQLWYLWLNKIYHRFWKIELPVKMFLQLPWWHLQYNNSNKWTSWTMNYAAQWCIKLNSWILMFFFFSKKLFPFMQNKNSILQYTGMSRISKPEKFIKLRKLNFWNCIFACITFIFLSSFQINCH